MQCSTGLDFKIEKEKTMRRLKLVDFGARFHYLAALETHRPKVLTDLQARTLPVYQQCWQKDPNTTGLQNLAQLSTAVRREAGGEFKAVAEALEKWADKHGFLDQWLKDAGIQSMYGWVHGENAGKWRYFPDELESPKFQSNFGHWIPFLTPWLEFKMVTDKIYGSRLAAYRAEVRRLWGEGKTKLQQHAEWTLMWQLDKSPEGIRNWHRHLTGMTVSVANIQLAVHAFAESAGIALRKPKAGRRAKKNVKSALPHGVYI
jgi:hypothetical protein